VATHSDHVPDGGMVELLLAEFGLDPRSGSDSEKASWEVERTHLLTCTDCARRAVEFRETLWALELATDEPAPGLVTQVWLEARRCLDLDSHPEKGLARRLTGKLGGLVRELAASLTVESATPSLAVRGANRAAPRLMVFETEEYTVSVSVSGTAQPDRFCLVGHVTPKVSESLPGSGQATVFGGAEVIRVPLNELGEFEVDAAPRGDLHIDLELGGARIQLSPVPAHEPGADPSEE
jgi:hypothetical protein